MDNGEGSINYITAIPHSSSGGISTRLSNISWIRLITVNLGSQKVLIWSVQLNFTMEIDRRICRIVNQMSYEPVCDMCRKIMNKKSLIEIKYSGFLGEKDLRGDVCSSDCAKKWIDSQLR